MLYPKEVGEHCSLLNLAANALLCIWSSSPCRRGDGKRECLCTDKESCFKVSVSPANNYLLSFIFCFFPPPQLGDWITLLRTFCPTWMPNRCVLLSWCARSGTGWHQTACCGRSSSREWSGQTPCGGDCQRGEDGEETTSSPLLPPLRTVGAVCIKLYLKRVI